MEEQKTHHDEEVQALQAQLAAEAAAKEEALSKLADWENGVVPPPMAVCDLVICIFMSSVFVCFLLHVFFLPLVFLACLCELYVAVCM